MSTLTLSAFTPANELVPLTSTLEEAWNCQLKIQDLEDKVQRLKETQSQIITEHVNANKLREGPFSIKEIRKSRRTFDAERFQEAEPELFKECARVELKVTIKDAEQVLGKKDIDKFCNVTETVTREIDWDPRYGATS